MEGGNGVSEANVVTLCSTCENLIALAENLHGWRSPSGAFAGIRNNLFRRNASPNNWIAAVSAAEVYLPH